MTHFYFQNKNQIIAELTLNKNNVIIHNYDKKLDKIYNNFSDWIKSRIEVANRLNIYDMCKIGGLRNLEDYAKATKSISATDTFWMNNTEDLKQWSKINVFKNRISKILADTALDGIQLLRGQNTDSPSPQYKLDGSADKCIKRHGINKYNSPIYLYKSCGEIWREQMNVRPYSEYLVSQLEEKLSFTDFVKYNIIEKTTESNKIKPYSICKIFTNENIGLVDYSDSIFYKTDLLTLRKIFKQREMKRDYNILTEMLILDSITLNIDRHDSNYAFIFNTNNLEIIGLSPIYDNDCSLASTISIKDKTFNDAYNELMLKETKTHLGTFNNQALSIINRDIYNKLKQVKHITFDFSKIKGMSDTRKEFIEYLVNRRIQEIIKLTEEAYHLT